MPHKFVYDESDKPNLYNVNYSISTNSSIKSIGGYQIVDAPITN